MGLIRKAIEAKIASLGLDWLELRSFQIHSSRKTVSASVLLEGEQEPIQVDAGYLVVGNKLVVTSVEASRKWVAEAAKLALKKTGGSYELPGGITGKMIRLML